MSNTNSTLSVQQPKVKPMEAIELPGLLPAMWTVATIGPKSLAWGIQTIAKAVGESHQQLSESSTDLIRNSVHHVNKTLVEWNYDLEDSLNKEGWYDASKSYLENKKAYADYMKNKKANQ